MNKCSRCDKEATYDNEGGLCDEHWADWWVEGMENEGFSPEEIKEAREEALKIAKANEDL